MNPSATVQASGRGELAGSSAMIARRTHVRVLMAADRACCCSARPSVVAVMPPARGRDHPTELLFCAHHFRQSRSQLAVAGAVSFDARGALIAAPRG